MTVQPRSHHASAGERPTDPVSTAPGRPKGSKIPHETWTNIGHHERPPVYLPGDKLVCGHIATLPDSTSDRSCRRSRHRE